MAYQNIKIPETGSKITLNDDGSLNVPNDPIIPYIEGDGIGIDITPAMLNVVDSAVAKSYGGGKKSSWVEVYCGEESTEVYGDDVCIPDTLSPVKWYVRLKQGQSCHFGTFTSGRLSPVEWYFYTR